MTPSHVRRTCARPRAQYGDDMVCVAKSRSLGLLRRWAVLSCVAFGCGAGDADSDCDGAAAPCEFALDFEIHALLDGTLRIELAPGDGLITLDCVAADRAIECAEPERDGLADWNVSVTTTAGEDGYTVMIHLDRGDDDSAGPNRFVFTGYRDGSVIRTQLVTPHRQTLVIDGCSYSQCEYSPFDPISL